LERIKADGCQIGNLSLQVESVVVSFVMVTLRVTRVEHEATSDASVLLGLSKRGHDILLNLVFSKKQ
jgi:hypothetical protein